LYFGSHFGFKMAAIANQRWTSICNIIIYLENKFRPNRMIFVFGGHFVPWLLWQRPPFWFFSTSKVCPTDSDFLGLSRSTRCGCCSYQVSLISVWRVTCYDNFCVFQFFSILVISMATAAILKKSTLISTTSHCIWYSYKVS
jgi:hypothetical protein